MKPHPSVALLVQDRVRMLGAQRDVLGNFVEWHARCRRVLCDVE